MPYDAQSRQDHILGIVVNAYIETVEPVGSRVICRRYKVDLSPASVRNVMADLEEQGYLAQPHTSAGRVPTDKGYRYYVNHLLEPRNLSHDEKERIAKEMGKARTVEGLIERLSKVISELTDNASVIYLRSLKRVSFLNYLLEELVRAERLLEYYEEEPELFIDGAFRILEQPEFRDYRRMRHLLQAFEEKEDLLEILTRDLDEEGVQVHIGRENAAENLGDVSVIVKDCYADQMPIGGVAVVGPTRMDYGKAMAVVDFVADALTETAKRF